MQTATIVYRNSPSDDASFELFGDDLLPTHWAYPVASAGDRAAFWRYLAKHAGTAFDAQMASGIGANGQPLMAVKRKGTLPKPGTTASKRWGKDLKARFGRDEERQDGPPLTPHRLASRCRRWARARPYADRVKFYWIGSHKGKKWGAIVAWHSLGMAGTGKKGQVTGKVRDIVGLADSFLAPAVAKAHKEWAASAGAKYEAMARAMAVRLRLLREEIRDLEAMAATVDVIGKYIRIQRRLAVVRSMADRIATDPILVAFVNVQRAAAPRPVVRPIAPPQPSPPQPQRRTLYRRTFNQ